ncbi:MAG TPA: Ig-like domain-containing protein, partial [Spirochaetia bacterium]|nr:Ig-like domain-containing protein [Spirochaetia bacterium]
VIKDIKDGQFDAVKLRVVNDKGRIYDTDLGSIMGSTAAPTIGLSSPLSGTWVRENLTINGQVQDNNGIAKLEWSIDNGRSWQQLDPPSGQGGPFTRSLTLPGPDNMVNLLIRATDPAGRTGTVLTVVRRDTQAPEIDLTLPTLDAVPQGTVIAEGRFRDEGALQKAEVSIAKKTYPLPIDRPFTLSLDSSVVATQPLVFRVTDWAGNVTERNYSLPVAAPTAAPAPAPTPTPDPAAAPADPNAPADPTVAATPTPVPAPVAPVRKPEIQILFPKPDTKGLNGVYPVVGRVVGFPSPPALTVKGEATGDKSLDLTDAGYFTFDVDVTNLKNRSVTLTALGDAKLASSISVNLPFDQASGLPVARFLTTADKPVLTGNVTASGWIGDSRGVVSWVSQLDGGEKKSVVPDPSKPPVGTFLVDLGVPSLGPHKLTVIPVNGQGKEGTPAVTEFVSTNPAGPVEFTSIDLGSAVVVTKDTRLQGRVPSINSWRKLEVRFADLSQPDPWNGPFQPLEVKRDLMGTWTFDVAVPTTLPFSRIGVIVRGEDSLGQKVEGRTLFHRVWPKDTSLITDNEGLYFVDDRLNDTTGRFDTVPGTPLSGVFRGRPIKSLSLGPNVPQLTAAWDGNRVTIDAKEEGLFGPFTVSVTTIDGEVFTSAPLTIYADATGPVIDWEVPLNADWIRDTVPIKGKVTDPSGVASLEVSVDAGFSWQPVAVKNGLYDARIPVPGADGLVLVVLKATDRGGHVTTDSRAVTKDTVAPTWTLVAPPEGRKVNGQTTIIASASDPNPVTQVEYSDDGKTFKLA